MPGLSHIFLMRHYNEPGHINVGTGEDLTIRELGEMIRDIIYPEALLIFDQSKPDGMPRKLLDVSKLHQLGWQHRMALGDGIADTYEWFVQRQGEPAATGRI